jgi:hypothetical protein
VGVFFQGWRCLLALVRRLAYVVDPCNRSVMLTGNLPKLLIYERNIAGPLLNVGSEGGQRIDDYPGRTDMSDHTSEILGGPLRRQIIEVPQEQVLGYLVEP